MSEAAFTKQVADLAMTLGWRVAHFRRSIAPSGNHMTPTAFNAKGYPDLTLVRDRVIFAELKMPGRKLEPEQERWRDDLLNAGQEWYCWYPRDLDEISVILSLHGRTTSSAPATV